ncbi:MAG: hypothetical protein J5930_11275 [Treponema sp.]|nr:hypothetical protein [Treponema sp.]
MKHILCADIGTSSLKAAVIDEKGRVASYSRQSFKKYGTENAASEWMEALKNAADELFFRENVSLNPLKVEALCISGNGPTIVSDKGLTLMWNVPVESGVQIPGGAEPDKKTKSLFIPRLQAFKKKYPKEWDESRVIFSGPEYLIYRLTNEALTILPEERYIEAYWSAESLADSGFTAEDEARLPGFKAPSTKAGALTKAAESFLSHEENGLCAGLPVYCGAPDFISALIGTNTLEAGTLCDRAGSSEGLNLCTCTPIDAPGIRTLPSIIPGLWNASVLIPDSGIRFANYKKHFEEQAGFSVTYADLVHAAITSDGNEPVLDQGKYLMLQIAMEARDGLSKLNDAVKNTDTPSPVSLTVTGGQAQNDDWTQMKSSVMGIEIHTPECHDAELIGDAALTFTGMGLFSDIKTAAGALHRNAKIFFPGGDQG